MKKFNEQEKKLLEKYVTSSEDDIFAVKGMEGMVGAAYARYSRAKGGFREVLLNEFIKEGIIDPKRADELIERILVAYGDDSVGELEGAHISFENISMVATKEIEHRRIGGSPIEQSTRYVFYDQKDENGNWKYLRHPSILQAGYARQYLETMDFIFDTYASLIRPVKKYFQELKPVEQAEYDINGDGEKEKLSDMKSESEEKAFRRTYTFDVRTKACDTLRCLLPLATLTNVGIFGNGRFFQNVISHMLTSNLKEVQEIADKAYRAASQIIPQYVRRAKHNDYQADVRKNMFALATQLFPLEQTEIPEKLPEVELLDPVDEDINTLAGMLYEYTNLSMKKLRKFVSSLPTAARQEIIQTYIGNRKTRRDRPGRALEQGYPYTFDLVTNWSVYKDLMRHRINTQMHPLYTTKLGFEIPNEIIELGLEKTVKACAEKSNELYETISRQDKFTAQYAVLHGSFTRWLIGMNDREAMHLTELRSTPQGHPQYRHIAQVMHSLIKKHSNWRGDMMKFVDYNDYYWSRADSEAKQRVREKLLDEKYRK